MTGTSCLAMEKLEIPWGCGTGVSEVKINGTERNPACHGPSGACHGTTHRQVFLGGEMIVTAWKVGASEEEVSTYGLRIGIPNRDKFFQREWASISLTFHGASNLIQVEMTSGFWRRCPELRSPAIKAWLKQQGLLTWPRGRPPMFRMEQIEGNRFVVYRFDNGSSGI
jgi:hypothetical protein